MKTVSVLLILAAPVIAEAQTSPTLTTIYKFQSVADGLSPAGGLVRDGKGVLYGTTTYGGTSGGTVYKLVPPPAGSSQWTHRVIHSFNVRSGDGITPVAGALAIDASGALYGATTFGGAYSRGMVYKLTPPGAGSNEWTETILYSFGGNDQLSYPAYGVILGPAGNIYGAAGQGEFENGAAYELSPPSGSSSPWTLKVLYSFTGGADGGFPTELRLDANGNLYGTTSSGGVFFSQLYGYLGTVFELSPPAQPDQPWTKTVLYSFPTLAAGFHPAVGVAFGAVGTLLGTTLGGAHGAELGTVFQLAPPGVSGQPWTETVLHSFSGPDGGFLESPITLDSHGNLYSTTFDQGDTVDCTGGCGTIFKLLAPSSAGGSWRSGWSIKLNGTNGWSPTGWLLMQGNGTIYGTTTQGGLFTTDLPDGYGTVYQIQP